MSAASRPARAPAAPGLRACAVPRLRACAVPRLRTPAVPGLRTLAVPRPRAARPAVLAFAVLLLLGYVAVAATRAGAAGPLLSQGRPVTAS